MEYGILNQSAVVIYGYAGRVKKSGGETVCAIADEGLYGMAVRITGEEEQGFLPVITHYGYRGYAAAEDLTLVGEEEVKLRDGNDYRVVRAACADVLSLPKVTGVPLLALYRGALVQMLEESGDWAKVRLLNGAYGYMRSQSLMKRRFSQSFLWSGILPQAEVKEEDFRREVVETALSYLGTQYRWGGKSSLGIDCSGLTSMAYMLNGILIYRDANIEDGYPVKKISITRIQPGDLLYFPGHTAMYLGLGRYVHATGREGTVTVSSLKPEETCYRKDLAEQIVAAGSIF